MDCYLPKISHGAKKERNGNCIRKAVLSIAYPMEFVTEIPPITYYGVWYIAPEYHVIESCIMNTIALVYLYCISKLYDDPVANTVLNMSPHLIHQTFKYLLSIDLCLHIYYKAGSKPQGRGLWWLLQPCFINQVLCLFFLYYPQYLTQRPCFEICAISMA
eukprot:158082_1